MYLKVKEVDRTTLYEIAVKAEVQLEMLEDKQVDIDSIFVYEGVQFQVTNKEGKIITLRSINYENYTKDVDFIAIEK